ncbi:MAG TPA: hypothetical protein VG944_11135 [Fimbriimonas sp.]|nr:hypothetical protein [Fimbriimonas sp.]
MQKPLIRRSPSNPILSADDWPYPIHTAFNPGATKLQDGRTLLLCRCEDHRGISHLCKAISDDGVRNWKIDEQPTFQSDPRKYPEELYGIEDSRVTYVPEMEAYVISYTAYGAAGPAVSLAKTKDFVTFERLGLAMQPDDKDAALLPRRFDGNFLLVHRPITHEGADIWIAQSPDLKYWGRAKLVLRARKGAWWDANKIGLSPPPIETSEGWLMFYHGVRTHASGSLYRMGLALLDKENPRVALLRGASWIMGPETDYERTGDVENVVFPCGYTLAPDNDTISLYYGAADSCICLAHASVGELLTWLHEHGEPVPRELTLQEGVENVP